jgi:hypothetical protein
MLEKKLERKMKKYSPKSKMLPGGCCYPVEEETTLHLGLQKGNNHVWRGWSRTMQSMAKLVTLISLMSNDPVHCGWSRTMQFGQSKLSREFELKLLLSSDPM